MKLETFTVPGRNREVTLTLEGRRINEYFAWTRETGSDRKACVNVTHLPSGGKVNGDWRIDTITKARAVAALFDALASSALAESDPDAFAATVRNTLMKAPLGERVTDRIAQISARRRIA